MSEVGEQRWVARDERLGREVIVEVRELGEEREWLRALARAGGPGVQRILRLEPLAGGKVRVGYEAIAGRALERMRLEAKEVERLRAALAPLHAAGHAHGSLSSSIVMTDGGVVLLVAGRRAQKRTIAEELAELEALAAR